ncbi:cation transporter [Bacteroidales bacterium]|nr:cation transporter [Bacteroidales bacterium]
MCGKGSYTLAHDILHIGIIEAEKIFVDHNLQLLAQRYSIDKAKADLIQARLFDNPSISIEQNIYNSHTKTYFDPRSQQSGEIEQLIVLAGKRGKRIQIERYNVDIANKEFEDLVLSLKFALRANMIDAHFTEKAIAIFNKEMDHIARLIDVYEKQWEKGNVSLMEKIRLQALFFSLKTEQLDYSNQMIDIQKQLRLLLHLDPQVDVKPKIEDYDLLAIGLETFNIDNMMSQVQENPKIRIAKINTLAQESNLQLQKRMRIPDLALRVVYDKESNIVRNYFGLGISMNIPLFDRNQGNIKAAKAMVIQSKLHKEYAINEIEIDFYAKLDKITKAYHFHKSFDKLLEIDLNHLIDGVSTSFEHRNINMLEFVDYYETYKETGLKLYENEKNLLIGIEELNMSLGQDHFKVWDKIDKN